MLDSRRAERQANIEAIGESEKQAHDFKKLQLKVILDLSNPIEDLTDSIKELIRVQRKT